MSGSELPELVPLSEHEALAYWGGTGDPELAKDIGRLLGGAAAALVVVGAAFYRSGGLTGGNPWMKR
jgi:hypothetical protein